MKTRRSAMLRLELERIYDLDSKIREVCDIAGGKRCILGDGYRRDQGIHRFDLPSPARPTMKYPPEFVSRTPVERQNPVRKTFIFNPAKPRLEMSSPLALRKPFHPVSQLGQHGSADK